MASRIAACALRWPPGSNHGCLGPRCVRASGGAMLRRGPHDRIGGEHEKSGEASGRGYPGRRHRRGRSTSSVPGGSHVADRRRAVESCHPGGSSEVGSLGRQPHHLLSELHSAHGVPSGELRYSPRRNQVPAIRGGTAAMPAVLLDGHGGCRPGRCARGARRCLDPAGCAVRMSLAECAARTP
jgi:hypothetical protein